MWQSAKKLLCKSRASRYDSTALFGDLSFCVNMKIRSTENISNLSFNRYLLFSSLNRRHRRSSSKIKVSVKIPIVRHKEWISAPSIRRRLFMPPSFFGVGANCFRLRYYDESSGSLIQWLFGGSQFAILLSPSVNKGRRQLIIIYFQITVLPRYQ